jgi:hypothetical protein
VVEGDPARHLAGGVEDHVGEGGTALVVRQEVGDVAACRPR